MNWRSIPLLAALLALLTPNEVLADRIAILPSATNQLCRRAIAAAERAHGIPAHLLAAIARVESGRRDQSSGTFDPWPWTINMDGQGSFYDNKSAAVMAAASMRPHVTRSIDVGCMQISLTHHPDAFAGMEQAFDPVSNAEYGARFLLELFQKTNSWPKAVEFYHSATFEIGQEYGRRVYAAWPEEQKLAETAVPSYSAFSSGWASSFNHSTLYSSLRPTPSHVIPLLTALGGAAPPGRSLTAYRLAPVRFAFRTQ